MYSTRIPTCDPEMQLFSTGGKFASVVSLFRETGVSDWVCVLIMNGKRCRRPMKTQVDLGGRKRGELVLLVSAPT